MKMNSYQEVVSLPHIISIFSKWSKFCLFWNQPFSNVLLPLSCTQRDLSLPGKSCKPIRAKIDIKNNVNISTSVIIFMDFINVLTIAFKPGNKKIIYDTNLRNRNIKRGDFLFVFKLFFFIFRFIHKVARLAK